MLDKKGNHLTSDKAISERAVEVYVDRLEGNKIKPHLNEMEKDVNKLCEKRLKETKLNKSKPWTLDNLNEAIKSLDRNKSRDALGMANELLKEEAAGTDLKLAILKLMNLIKDRQKFPEVLELCNITSLYKHKGSHKDFNNYRGVFRLCVFRSILDRLMYNDNYHIIDQNLTDGNVGARKERSVRDNVFVLGAITNSVTNGKMAPIQISVTDVEKCFDKMWLQATINALYEAGITNDTLNILYMENRNAQIAIKVNNKLTKRVLVKDVVMQGSVWGSIKCTTTMDKLNKAMRKEVPLQYLYQNDPNIPIGVLGMIDDTLDISECGNQSVAKNAVLNSFLENQRLQISHEKSAVIHIGNASKCKQRCPRLKVHEKDMKTASSSKYLGDMVSGKASVHDTIERRRSEGWGKVSQILGILNEVPTGTLRTQIGLKMRETKLCNNLLYNAEAWSYISDRDISRLEQVDLSLLKSLVGAKSKMVNIFVYLELGILKPKHVLTVRRLMYHYHILTRDDEETIKKIYNRQKVSHMKEDWYMMLVKDFDFIQTVQDDEQIRKIAKHEYLKYVKSKVEQFAFQLYLQKKTISKKKLKEIKYQELKIQSYMNHKMFGEKEIKIMCLLRSKSYPAKMNYKKMNKNNLKCSFNCKSDETQNHIFEQCLPIIEKMEVPKYIELNKIYGSIEEQCEIIQILVEIDRIRTKMKKETK